ncbi:MAG: branched-chain amino acid transporter permease [Proteobacteria bacterium]|nr:branched-chain amino acid transporter permease [Pseudomonadota bacterium]
MSNKQALAADDSLPKKKLDLIPVFLIPVLALLVLPLYHLLSAGSTADWATATIAGIGMGLIIFLVASGFSLVFGLMDVLNFGHGIFVTLGAYFGVTFLAPMQSWYEDPQSIALNLLALAAAAGLGMLVTAVIGLVFERVIVRPVYGAHLTQILVTSGGLIVAGELCIVFWGPDTLPLLPAPSLTGALTIGNFAVEKFRLMTLVVGIVLFLIMQLLLNRTKLGLLIRAGVQDREMVEALGYKVKFLFVAVFAAGAALASLGGTFFGIFMNGAGVGLGPAMMINIFIVIIIAGMGSVGGALIASIMVGITANFTGSLFPNLQAFSSIALMCLIILWRPQGLYPVAKR